MRPWPWRWSSARDFVFIPMSPRPFLSYGCKAREPLQPEPDIFQRLVILLRQYGWAAAEQVGRMLGGRGEVEPAGKLPQVPLPSVRAKVGCEIVGVHGCLLDASRVKGDGNGM
jgi:hypothetical protein